MLSEMIKKKYADAMKCPKQSTAMALLVLADVIASKTAATKDLSPVPLAEQDGIIRTKGDLWKYLERVAKDYVKYGVRKHLKQAKHMHDAKFVVEAWAESQQKLAEAILVDFINAVGTDQGLDVGLYTKHLHEE